MSRCFCACISHQPCAAIHINHYVRAELKLHSLAQHTQTLKSLHEGLHLTLSIRSIPNGRPCERESRLHDLLLVKGMKLLVFAGEDVQALDCCLPAHSNLKMSSRELGLNCKNLAILAETFVFFYNFKHLFQNWLLCAENRISATGASTTHAASLMLKQLASSAIVLQGPGR